ncbi:MAG: sulfatase [Deltaproteobacteria bacterium]|nr:sulfatase [Deltaproteobacteria bacterium]MBW2416086.1 sulfatase [Deltaproteobacteria bacterium]
MMRRLAPVLLGLASLGCAGEAPVSIVMITIDTLRADHVGSYGYFRDVTPAIDALASEGVLFEHAIAPMATTLPSHTSLLTSSYPARHGVRANFQSYQRRVPLDGDDFQTFAQLLKRAGYETAAFVSVYHLRPETGIAAGFDTFDTVPGDRGGQGLDRITRTADQTTRRAVDWLGRRTDDRPFFMWVHYFDPHSPYSPPARYRQAYGDAAALTAFIREKRVPERYEGRTRALHDRYDGEIRFADDQIGVLFAALRRLGLYDDAAIVLTADHGEGLGQHGVLEHGVIFNEQIEVPLILRLPKGARAGERVATVVSLIDVLPTLVSVLGLSVPTAQFDGIDVLSEERRYALAEREYSKRRFGSDVNLSLTGERWKYVYHSEQADSLFDLGADPVEVNDVLADHPEVAAAMRQEILRLVEQYGEEGAALGVEPTVSPEMREALETLGYVE